MKIQSLFLLLMLPVTSILVLILHVQFKYGGSQVTATITGLRTSIFTTTSTALALRTETSFTPLSQAEVDGVEKFVLFFGHASVISAIMDAHPNIIISHEYHVLHECVQQGLGQSKLQSKASLFYGLYENSYNSSKYGLRSKQDSDTVKGHDLHINTRWQGAFGQLRSIGDNDGDLFSTSFSMRPMRGISCLRLLRETVKIPIVVFHVIQNPFDTIATNVAAINEILDVKEMVPKGTKLRVSESTVMNYARAFFKRAEGSMEAIKAMKKMTGLTLMEIHNEHLLKHPREIIMKACMALGVPCPYGYVEACVEKIFRDIPKTRQSTMIEWDEDVVTDILELMQEIPFFSTYTL